MDECFSMEGFEGPVVKIEPEDEWTEHSDSISESRVGNEAQAPLQSETVVKEEITDIVPSDVSSGEESEDNAGMDPDTFKTFVKEEMEAAPGGLKPKSEDEPGPSGIADVKQEDLSGAEAGTDEEMYDSEEESDTDMYTEGLSEGQAIKTENQEPSVKEESVENLSEGASNLTLPEGLCIRKMKRDGVGEAVEGVWSTKMLTKGTVFGPYATQASSTATKTGMPAADYAWTSSVRESSVKAWCNTEALRTSRSLSLVTTINIRPGTELIQQIDLSKLSIIKPSQGSTPFKCPDCVEQFAIFGQLSNHLLSHKNTNPHRCLECGRSFKYPANLEDHISIHTGDKPHKCMECGKHFSSLTYLKKHKLVHIESRPWKCSHCERTFKSNRYLKVHEWTHTGEKPYKCTECGKYYKSSSSLKRHQRLHLRV